MRLSTLAPQMLFTALVALGCQAKLGAKYDKKASSAADGSITVDEVPMINKSVSTNVPVSGTCAYDGTDIFAVATDGKVPTDPSRTTCGNGTWSTTVDVSPLADGKDNIKVEAGYAGTDTAVSTMVSKDTTVNISINAIAEVVQENNFGYPVSGTCETDGVGAVKLAANDMKSSIPPVATDCEDGKWSAKLNMSNLDTGLSHITVTAGHMDAAGNTDSASRKTSKKGFPPVFADVTAQIFTQNIAIETIIIQNSGGVVLECSSVPALPAGLKVEVSGNTCAISGTPTVAVNTRNYSIEGVATDKSSDIVQIKITVLKQNPPVLANQTSDFSFVTGFIIPDIVFVNTGAPALACSSQPALPAGLAVISFNQTCQISGTPTAAAAETVYTIVGVAADNSTGPATAKITVIAANPPVFTSPTLVKDINNSVTGNDEGNSKNFVALANGKTLFVAMNYQVGEELWVTDGTGAGTYALDAINPNSSSFPGAIQINAGRTAVVFNCNSESAGAGVCVSDGTIAGTRRLAGEFSGSASNLRLCGARIFATGTFGANGSALVSSDGTSALALAASYATMGATGVSQLTCAGSRLYFTTSDSSTGAELWTSDGTSSGTYLVRDVYSGSSAGLTSILGSLGNKVLLQAKTSTYTGNELWMYDPEAADCGAFDGPTGTCVAATNGTGFIGMVKDIYPGGTNGSNIGVASGSALVMNGKLYFQGINSASNSELWYTDGTNAGTVVVYDFAGTAGAPDLSKATVYDAGGSSRLYYSTYRGGDGYGSEPHMLALDATGGCATYGADFRTPTNGGGCVGMISDMLSGSSGYIVTFYGANANGAYFKGNSGTLTYYHWDNTTSAPVAFTSTVAPDSGAAITASGLLYSTFSSPPGVVGGKRELWFTDGSAPTLVKEINAEAGSIGTNNSGTSTADAQIGTRRYFSAWDETNGVELWVTDGTAGGTRLVKDISAGAVNSAPTNLVVMSGVLFFQATNGSLGAELWAYDPAAADCSRFDPATSYATSCDTADSVNVPGKIGMVKDINVGATGSNVSLLSLVDGRLYFVATTAAEGTEPYVSDGTASGTVLLQNLATGSGSSTGSKFAKAGSAVVFQATNGSGQNDLFAFIRGPEADDAACTTSHGAGFARANAAGCYKLLYDFTATSPAITMLGSSGNGAKAFFRAAEAASGAEVWVTDGTTAGTAMVLDIFPGSGGSASVVTGGTPGPFGTDKFVFPAIDSYTASGVPSQQIWITDGTAGGTTPISAFDAGYHAKGLVVDNVGPRIFFIGGSAAHGMELWKSDGTLAGTQMVDDFCPGACNGAIAATELNNISFGLTSLEDGRMIYRGNDGSSGSEPVVSDGTAAGTYRIDLAPGSASSSPIRFLPVSDGSAVTKIVIFASDGFTGFEPWVVSQ